MNAEEVARVLGCSSKTVRRHLEKGTITARRKASGELKISDDQVEKLRLVLELEEKPGHVQQRTPIDGHEQPDMSRQVASLAQLIANLNTTQEVLTRELGKLQARCDVQQSHIEELERRIADLETKSYPVIAENAPSPPTLVQPLQNTTKIESPLSSTTEPNRTIPANLPPGTLSSSEFAAQLGVNKEEFKRYMKRGIYGEYFEMIEIPHYSRTGYTNKYFTHEQAEKAIALLKKHGKLPGD